MFAHDTGCREIHQVPIVDALCPAQVEVKDGLLLFLCSFLVFHYQHQQCTHAALVPLAVEQAVHHLQRCMAVLLGHQADVGHGNPQELVTFAIFPPSRLEEAGKYDGLLGINVLAEGVEDGIIHWASHPLPCQTHRSPLRSGGRVWCFRGLPWSATSSSRCRPKQPL